MSEKEKKVKERAYGFAIEIIKLIQTLPKNTAGFELGRQVLRSGTSIGANVEEATGARSRKEFINCMNIAKREARETNYWLRLLNDSKLLGDSKLQPLLDEIEIILKILTSIVKTSEINS